MVERLIEILKYVVDMFNAHTKPNHFGCDSHVALFFGRKLTVGCGCGMARQ
jgi:hypothetical protein